MQKLLKNQRYDNSRSPRRPLSVRDTSALKELLRELAFLLLARGIAPKIFNELSRAAFVGAAAERSRLRNGRVNYSRVAAQTGLSRADVKRLLEQSSRKTSLAVHQTAVERVINGWECDTRFSRIGKPRLLRITGPNSSFASLAKNYAGDVPHRAVLTELQRLGAVNVRHEYVQLRDSRHLRRGRNLGSLYVALPALIDGLRIAAATKKPDLATSVHRLLLPADSDLDLAFVRERCISTVAAMLDGLDHSLGEKARKSRKGRTTNASFAVTVLLVENGATEMRTERQQGKGKRAHGK